MKCPNCEYRSGWNNEILENETGDHGNFLKASNNIVAEKIDADYEDYSRIIYFCPKCGIGFIEV